MKITIEGQLGEMIRIRGIKHEIINDEKTLVGKITAKSGSVTFTSKDVEFIEYLDKFKNDIVVMYKNLCGSAELPINGQYNDYLKLTMKSTGRVIVDLSITDVRDNDLINKAIICFETDQSFLPNIFE
jgi:hypothetical protein